MTGFAKRAKELGARVWLDTAVTGVNVENGAVTGVRTTREMSRRATWSTPQALGRQASRRWRA